MVGTLSSDRVTLTRIRGVVYGAKETVRLTRLLPVTLPSVIQVEPSQAWTVKSVMPYTLKVRLDRKSTRLNSSHLGISYAVFCLKKTTLKSICTQPGGALAAAQ